MIEASVRTVNDVIADFLASKSTDEEVLACHMPSDLQERFNLLLDLNSEDELTKKEIREMHEYLRANGFVSLLKAKVKRRQRLGIL